MFSHKSIFSRHDNNLESSICLLHYQLINHPFNHPVTLLITQSPTESSCYTINHSIILLHYQSSTHTVNHPLNHPVTLSIAPSPTQSSCYTIKHSITHSIILLHYQSLNHPSIIHSITMSHYHSLNHLLNHPVTLSIIPQSYT